MAGLNASQRFGELNENDSIVRLLRVGAEELEPDALYRRRLRGEVLNRHVALREGLLQHPRRRRMTRLGRAVLLASLTVTTSVAAASAASQDAIPGQLLYPVKRQVEAIRLDLASGSLRSDLLEVALSKRVEELDRLASSAEWGLVSAAGRDVSAAEEALLTSGRPLNARSRAQIDARIAHLEILLGAAPEAARTGLQQALDAANEDGSSRTGDDGAGPAPAPLGHKPAEPPGQGAAPGGAQPTQGSGAGDTRSGTGTDHSQNGGRGNGKAIGPDKSTHPTARPKASPGAH